MNIIVKCCAEKELRFSYMKQIITIKLADFFSCNHLKELLIIVDLFMNCIFLWAAIHIFCTT